MPHETDLVVGKKPGTVYTPADWFTSGYTISVNAGTQRAVSEQVIWLFGPQASGSENSLITCNLAFWLSENSRRTGDISSLVS